MTNLPSSQQKVREVSARNQKYEKHRACNCEQCWPCVTDGFGVDKLQPRAQRVNRSIELRQVPLECPGDPLHVLLSLVKGRSRFQSANNTSAEICGAVGDFSGR